ncbi:MAG: tetratricopeptide repeat protein [Bacteroidetes bacterium]|nr:tetratricopeptide repeat protein [Fibrella sp.]
MLAKNVTFPALLLLATLVGCGTSDRQQAGIPALPQANDSIRTQAALVALTRAINQASPASAYAKRAALYLSAGRVKEALADIDEAISRNSNAGTYFLTKAAVLRALNQPDKALEVAQRAEILGVDTPELYTLLGDLLQQQSQFGKARLYVAKALQMAPYDGEAYFFNGLMAAKLGDTTQALALYQTSLRLKPRYLPTYQQLASVHRSLGNLGAAMTYNEQAVRYFPDNAQLQYSRGLIYQTAGKLDSALTAYQQATRLKPDLYQAVFQTGLIYQKVRAYPLALSSFQRVQQLQPQFPRIDFFIGSALEQSGQWEPAIAAYAKAMQLDPADQQAYYGYWRAQKRQSAPAYGSYSGPGPGDGYAPAPTGRVLDTSRIRISTIQPRTRPMSTRSDSMSRTVKPLN